MESQQANSSQTELPLEQQPPLESQQQPEQPPESLLEPLLEEPSHSSEEALDALLEGGHAPGEGGDDAEVSEEIIESAADEQSDTDWLAEFTEESKFSDLDLDWLPEGTARDRARRLLTAADERTEALRNQALLRNDEIEVAKAAYETETAALRRVVEQLGDDTTLSELDDYKKVMGANQIMAKEVTAMAWQAFDMAFPEWSKAPPSQLEAFKRIVMGDEEKGVQPTLLTQAGDTYFDKMTAAWTYAAYEAGQPKPQRFSGIQQPSQTAAPTAAPTQASSDARSAAAVIGASTSGYAQPVRPISEMTRQEILDRHDHLLDD